LHCFFTSLTIWAHNIADLSRDHRVYAPDMMGQPSRSIPRQPVRNRREMAEWVTGIVDGLGVRRFDLVGYSYGGFAALNYSIYAQDRLRKLILLSPVGGLVSPRAQFYIRGMLTGFPGLAAPAMTSFFRWMFYEPNLKKENVRPLVDHVLRQMVLGRKYFRMGTIVPPGAFPDEELRAVRTPTLLLVGEQEALYDPVAAVERAQRLVSNVQTQLIPQAGHDLPASQPQTVNKRVLQFLKERGQA
jgi:pimeloyl-ACP methyl ester carboxylesterase